MQRLFVANLDYRESEEDIRKWFADQGHPVREVHLVYNLETTLSKGFGFVTLSNPATEAEQVCRELNGLDFSGRAVVVALALPRKSPAQRRGTSA